MDNKKIFFSLFILLAIAQLYVPAKMIMDREDVIKTGKEFKFKTAPVDPNDVFRGKYIWLQYDARDVEIVKEEDWLRDEEVYVLLASDQNGYAKISSVQKDKPEGNADYVKVKVDQVSKNKLSVNFPFNRFYMEESKAQTAEDITREASRDTEKQTYALVNIKNGEAVLRDVLINGISVRELAK